VIGVPGLIVETYFRTEQKAKQQYYLRISAAIINMICPILFITALGVKGAAVGKLLSNAVMSIVGVILLILETKRVLPKS